MRAVIALAFGGVPALGIGLVLLIAAKLWSEFERRRSERRLARLLRSESADVRRYAVRSVADPSRHATTLLQYRSVETDPENLKALAEHVEGCRWSRSPSLDWLALRQWALVFQPRSSTGGPSRPPETARGSTGVGDEHATAAPAARLADKSRVRRFGLNLAVAGGPGRRVGGFNGFPKGYDALSRLATIRLVLDNFPHLLWNYAWYGGFPPGVLVGRLGWLARDMLFELALDEYPIAKGIDDLVEVLGLPSDLATFPPDRAAIDYP